MISIVFVYNCFTVYVVIFDINSLCMLIHRLFIVAFDC